MAIKRGQITKKDVVSLLASLDSFEENIAERRKALSLEFNEWIDNEIGELRQRIKDQDYLWSLQSVARHISSSFLRMESGEIKSLTKDGGFNIRN